MIRRIIRTESGQSMVLIALAMVAIIAMAALVLDGGYAFLERRRAQNAADAAALAGARALAKGQDDAAIRSEVNKYALQNGVVNPATDVRAYYVDVDGDIVPNSNRQIGSMSGSGSPPNGAKAVLVQAKKVHDTFFADIIGVPTMDILASAQAGYDAAARVPGMMPFAVYTETVVPTGTITLWDSDCLDEPFTGCVNGQDHRGWLNLDGQGQGNDLVTWMMYGYDLDADVPLWINGAGGVHDSAVQAAEPWIGQIVFIPIYDTYAVHGAALVPPDDYPNPGNQQRDYHIVGFAAFRLTSVTAGGGVKGITGTFVRWAGASELGGGVDFGVGGLRMVKPVGLP